jgi:hypothetical protein
MRGSNPRPLAHKTNTLPTELMEHVCRSWLPASHTYSESRVRGLVVMIVACQVMDPGSIPGERILFFYPPCWPRPRLVFRWEQLHHRPCRFAAEDNLKTILPMFSPVQLQEEPSPACSPYPEPTLQRPKKRDPRNRSRTSDLEISIVAIYSLPLCQLSYTRTYGSVAPSSRKRPGCRGAKPHTQKSRCRCGLWGSNPRSYEHAP